MKKLTIILIIVFTSIISFGQNNDLPNREAFTLKLVVDSINFYQSEIKQSPYVLPENIIQVYPGEKIYVEVEMKKKKIESLKTVKENLNPDKTITISFEQKTDGQKHEFMMLSIENPFNKKLEYKALMFLMEYNRWAPTNVLPIGAKLGSYESWPDIIVTITLSELKFK